MATAIKMPQLGLTMTEGLVSEWKKQAGDAVKTGDVLLEIETDKLSSQIEAEADGVLLQILTQEGESAEVQGILGYIGQPGETIVPDATPLEAPPAAAPAAPEPAEQAARVAVSPYAKRTAEALGVDYRHLAGTGPDNRIVARDISAHTDAIPAQQTASTPMSGMRRTIAKRMAQAHTEIPPVTMSILVDVTELLKLRTRVNEAHAQKISVNDFVTKGVAKALAENKYMLVSMAEQAILQHADVNIGMAVAVEGGLIVPVIRNADRLSLGALSAMAKDLAARAKENTLGMDEYAGSTFSITNLGMYGIDAFTPIINLPNAAILGVCAAQGHLQMADGELRVRKQMPLCLTIDHRLIDGAPAAQFLQRLKAILENPLDMVI